MSEITAAPLDRRVRRTRDALRLAFRELFFAHGLEAISVSDIAERANVGRSTFYKHFESKEDMLARSIGPFLSAMAEACVSDAEPPDLARTIEHFWQNRRFARTVFGGASQAVVARTLAGMIAKRLRPPATGRPPVPASLAAETLAAGQLTLLTQWLLGRGGCSAQELAAAMHRSSRAAAGALVSGG